MSISTMPEDVMSGVITLTKNENVANYNFIDNDILRDSQITVFLISDKILEGLFHSETKLIILIMKGGKFVSINKDHILYLEYNGV